MRRKTSTVLAATVALMLASCGSDDSTADETTASSETAANETAGSTQSTGDETTATSESAADESTGAQDLTALFVNPLPQFPTWRTVGDCLAEGAEQRGIEMTESGPSGQAIDAVAMINQIQQGIANDVDAIITFPVSDGFSPVLQDAQAAGIVTATIFGSGEADSGADLNFTTDFELNGRQYIDALDPIEGDKVIGLIAAADAGAGQQWMDGIRTAAEGRDDVTIAGAVYTGDDSSKALDQTNALLTAHPDVNVIATHMGTVTQGAVAAIESQDKIGEIFLVGVGTDNGGAQALESGAALAMQMNNSCEASRAGMHQIIDRIEGTTAATNDLPEEILGSEETVTMATKDNYQTLMDNEWQ